MRARSLGLLALASAVGCGLTFSPGDYAEPATPSPAQPDGSSGGGAGDGGGPGDAGTDSAVTEAGAAVSAHVLLFAGRKDDATETNDVWSVPVNDRGELGTFTYEPSTPLLKSVQAVGLAGGHVLAASQGTSSRVVQSADFDGGLRSVWTSAVVASPSPSAYGSFFARTSLVVVGGRTTETVDDGMGGTTTVTVTHPELLVSRASGTQYAPPNNVASTVKLPVGLYDPTIAIYKDFAYLQGRGDAGDQASKVYMGRVDETLGLASVTAASSLVGGDGKPYGPIGPITCAGAGRLYVVGGEGATTTLGAPIDEATGALGAWKTGPNLPVARDRGACVVVGKHLYVFGGRLTGAGSTAQVLRSTIAPDGALGEWETMAQALPAARANVFALTY